uniref:ribonuclease H n=1 Tax=Pygocentrus nattereri TaxID=42514 RepID=A0AAR2JHU7_PYGNA
MDGHERFLKEFKLVFDHPYEGKVSGELLTQLRQGPRSVVDYALEFRTLAASSGWNETALLVMFRHGLNPEVLNELASKDDGLSLDQLISLAIKLDHLMNSRRKKGSARGPRNISPPVRVPGDVEIPEPMVCESSRLSQEERQHRFSQQLCFFFFFFFFFFFCGQPGHRIRDCRKRTSQNKAPNPGKHVEFTPRANVVSIPTKGLVSKSVLLPVRLCFHPKVVVVSALIDSGAEGNFIHAQVVEKLRIPVKNLRNSLEVTALDGDPVGFQPITHVTVPIETHASALYSEKLSFLILDQTDFDVILGLPWLEKHNPTISWTDRTVTQWSEYCFKNCLKKSSIAIRSTTIESPDTVSPFKIPQEYLDLKEVFSKKNATKLPAHRPYDCAIDLVSEPILPKARVYPLTQEEQKALDSYIDEALDQGFIRPSTSPIASSFFFIKKKDGGLRPCIDYRALNQISKAYPYPLSLVPVALEQLQGAQYFTKLDLRSAYNLIRIKEGDEWKTSFLTTRGRYEYLVMPFGLSVAPSVFQAFINDVLRDMLGKFVIAYLDDILVYSPSLEKHIHHVREVLMRLLQNNLYLKGEKCEFHLRSVAFLGYIISQQGIVMDDHKVEAVLDWPQPTSIKELQKFLGFANFYRRFIRNFSGIAAPLTSLLKGNPKRIYWNTQAEKAFQDLKKAFTQAPILAHPDPKLPFVVEVDASETGGSSSVATDRVSR